MKIEEIENENSSSIFPFSFINLSTTIFKPLFTFATKIKWYWALNQWKCFHIFLRNDFGTHKFIPQDKFAPFSAIIHNTRKLNQGKKKLQRQFLHCATLSIFLYLRMQRKIVRTKWQNINFIFSIAVKKKKNFQQ